MDLDGICTCPGPDSCNPFPDSGAQCDDDGGIDDSLGTLVKDGAGILCVTHDVNLLAYTAAAPRVLGLAAGELRFALDYLAPELPARLSELFGVHMLALAAGGGRVIVPAPPRATEPNA